MAILITQVKVDEVPDDRLPEIISHSPELPGDLYGEVKQTVRKEVCQPYNVEWYRLPTRKEVETGNFEIDRETGEPMPVRDRYVIFMSEEVQHKLGMLHETWAWLCCQYVGLSERNQTNRDHALSLGKTLVEMRDWYINVPWYKRVWRALWIRN